MLIERKQMSWAAYIYTLISAFFFIGFCFGDTVQTFWSVMLGLLYEGQISEGGIMRQWFTALRDQPCSCSLKTLMLLSLFEVIKGPILGNYIFPLFFFTCFSVQQRQKLSLFFYTPLLMCHSHLSGLFYVNVENQHFFFMYTLAV